MSPLLRLCSRLGSFNLANLWGYGKSFNEASNLVDLLCTSSISWHRILLHGCHALFPYSNIGLTRDLNNWTNTSSERKSNVLRMTPIILFALDVVLWTCSLKFSLLSMYMPRSFSHSLSSNIYLWYVAEVCGETYSKNY